MAVESGGAPLDIRVRGAYLPERFVFGMQAMCTIGRMAYLAIAAARSDERFDLVFYDVVSHVVPLLKHISSAKVLFYCHFPDQLEAPQGGALYQRYRALLARLEVKGMRMADRVVVNSRFTETMVRRTFPSDMAIDLLYPAAVDVRESDDFNAADEHSERPARR